LINLLFAGLFDLIIGIIKQMGLLVPNAAALQLRVRESGDLNKIFEHRDNLPGPSQDQGDRGHIGTKIIAYCK
jgi:hypothetical protein